MVNSSPTIQFNPTVLQALTNSEDIELAASLRNQGGRGSKFYEPWLNPQDQRFRKVSLQQYFLTWGP